MPTEKAITRRTDTSIGRSTDTRRDLITTCRAKKLQFDQDESDMVALVQLTNNIIGGDIGLTQCG